MRKHRAIVFIAALLLGIIVVFATAADGGMRRGDKKPNRNQLKNHFPKENHWGHFPITRYRVLKELGLTDTQWENIKKLRNDLKEEMRKVRTEHRDDILNVLTPAQRDTLEIRIKEINIYRRQHRDQHRDGYRYRQRLNRRNNDAPLMEQIDYIQPSDSTHYAAIPSTYRLDENLLLVNKPVVTNSREITWGDLKNMYR